MYLYLWAKMLQRLKTRRLKRIFRPRIEPHIFRDYKVVLMSRFTVDASRVLEVGCGLKHYARFSKSEYIGIDIFLRPDIIASAEALPFRDKCFDRIVIFDVIEHVKRVDQALRDCRRVLKPSGLILLLTPNTLGLGIYDSFADPTHLHHFTWFSLRKKLHKNGLRAKRFLALHFHILWPFNLIKRDLLYFIQQSICLIAEREDGAYYSC